MLPPLIIENASFVSIETLDQVNLDSTAFEVLNFSEKGFFPKKYHLINLGSVRNSWDTNQLDQFTDVITERKKEINLLGYIITTSLKNSVNLPFVKVAVHNIKQYLARRKKTQLFVGLYIEDQDLETFDMDYDRYFHCNTSAGPDFYMSNNTIQATKYYESSSQVNCRDLSNATIFQGLAIDRLPYSPRKGRCNCIMASLHCMINPDMETDVTNQSNLLTDICNEVYCGSIENDPNSGDYGIFGGCSLRQKISIALNLYYSYHNKSEEYCNFNGTASILQNNRSGFEYQFVRNDQGIQCDQEIQENWSNYLIGVDIGSPRDSKRDKAYEEEDYPLKDRGNVLSLSSTCLFSALGILFVL